MFGGMENCLFLCKRILFDVSINSSTAMTIIHSDESQNIEFKESWTTNTFSGYAALPMRRAAGCSLV